MYNFAMFIIGFTLAALILTFLGSALIFGLNAMLSLDIAYTFQTLFGASILIVLLKM